MTTTDSTVVPQETREALLAAAVARLTSQGWTVTSQFGSQVTLNRRKRIGWFWNTVLSIVTSGLWLIRVAYLLVNRRGQTVVVRVDETGKVTESPA